MTIIINKDKKQITRGDDCPSKTVIVSDGKQGPPGLSNLFFFVRRAAEDLGGHRAVISNEAGTVVVFPSFLLHGVENVTSGVRYSLVTWMVGPSFR